MSPTGAFPEAPETPPKLDFATIPNSILGGLQTESVAHTKATMGGSDWPAIDTKPAMAQPHDP
ncbi:MAG: hypothetical protein HW409_863 [candidate division NC10 bacterium]|nr:hypothetical protein [candidate division NC10 bacterium]